MNYLLDTCVLSEFRKKQPEPNVISWIALQDEDSLYLSVITIGEIQKCVTRLPSSKRKTELNTWLEDVVYRYDSRLLSVDLEVMQAWAKMSADLETKGRIIPTADSLIAATARVHDLVVVTRNENDFSDTGVQLMNVWL